VESITSTEVQCPETDFQWYSELAGSSYKGETRCVSKGASETNGCMD
jgi:hypothetical protein